jgi:hypothetical protein
MKRKALLIGNSNGLSGVKLDISNFTAFLKSDVGGGWYNSEIVIKMNPIKRDLMNTISQLKNEKNDFSFVLFSGHGGYQKGTILEINNNEETINERDLEYIAPRQISIFDCCRNVVNISAYENLFEKSARMFDTSVSNIRAKYDVRIMQAIEQQVSLYACSVNESALDTDDGGLYINNLLKAASNVNSEYKRIEEAHEEARDKTKNEAKNKGRNQNPTATLPKCLSTQQLIISINPSYNYKRY